MEESENKQKPLSGKYQNIKAILFFIISATVISISMIVKFAIVEEIKVGTPVQTYILSTVGVWFVMGAMLLYMLNSRRSLVNSLKPLYAVCTAVTFSYILNIYFSMISVYAMPTMLVAFIVAPISKRRDAFVGNLFCNVLILATCLIEINYGSSASILSVIVMFAVGISFGTVVAYVVSSTYDRIGYVIKGLIISTLNIVMVLTFVLVQGQSTVSTIGVGDKIATLILFLVISSYSSIFIGLILQPIFELIFNLVTNSRLVEFTDHNSPLIKRLRTEAPGTFNHSLAVANFAEMCASAIGENPYLARACAYYHDIGKIENPEYYKENQAENNFHDELLPEVSAGIIRTHTNEGEKLCREHRIPTEISHVTVQHHGTLLIPVFYQKAKGLTDGEVNEYDYSYHGTIPETKVAAIIMLCDAGEAAIRAMDLPNGEKVDKLLSDLISSRIQAGQFDNCDISLRDLNKIKTTIISAYGGLYHKRLKYPGGEK